MHCNLSATSQKASLSLQEIRREHLFLTCNTFPEKPFLVKNGCHFVMCGLDKLILLSKMTQLLISCYSHMYITAKATEIPCSGAPRCLFLQIKCHRGTSAKAKYSGRHKKGERLLVAY